LFKVQRSKFKVGNECVERGTLNFERVLILPPAPPTAMIPTVVAQISTVPRNFPAVLPNLAPVAGKLRPASPVVQITEKLSPVPVELAEVTA
jgi:hypothetical protein